MLTLQLPEKEMYDEKTSKITLLPGVVLKMEHSLISLSKWESWYKKPFLKDDKKTDDELYDYFRAMVIGQDVPIEIIRAMGVNQYRQVINYINDPMTATTFGADEERKLKQKRFNSQIFTSELIYYYMIAYNIPVEFEKWHLNRLLTLIRVCEIKNEEQSGNGKKMSKRELLKRNAEINAKRRAALNTKG